MSMTTLTPPTEGKVVSKGSQRGKETVILRLLKYLPFENFIFKRA